MKTLWAPWRMAYITQRKLPGCLLCQKPKEKKDKKNYLLHRSDLSYVMLNAFPYNNGHLLISPYAHVETLEDLEESTILDMMRTTKKALRALRSVFSPDGFNMGINEGPVAGAGIPSHIHLHLVPRWRGDTNFMPIFSETRVMPQHLASSYARLLPYFTEKRGRRKR